jgi:LemA protein
MTALIIVLVVTALIGLFLISQYNRLVGLRNRFRNAFAQIDVQLKRRYDLIPNLVETAKGYMKHERETLQALTGTLGRFFALSEAYPDLKANQNMLALQEELSSTENKVAFARQAYNDAVMRYNTARESFPTVIIAGMFGFDEAVLFTVESEAERAAPRVSF